MNSNFLLGLKRTVFASVTIVVSFMCMPGAQAMAGRSAAFVLDTTSGRVLYSREGDARRYPASLTKMMTLYLLFEDTEKKRVSTTTRFRVSKHAAAQEPSKLSLKPPQYITAEEANSCHCHPVSE
jgi:D-alanyl-D-alanine carboxypeptidase